MRQEIINQMEVQLDGGRFQSYDFNIDKRDLEDKDELFLWTLRKDGTSLQMLGKTFEEQLKNESFRMRIFKDKMAPIKDFLYWSESLGCKTFYYDYFDLREIQKEDVEKIYLNIWNDRIEQLKKEHKDEAEASGKQIEIVCRYGGEAFLREQLMYAESLKDDSLKNILDRFKNYIRMSIDHKIFLLKDGEHDFYFEERVNGKTRLNGGIIFHANKSENRWESHT